MGRSRLLYAIAFAVCGAFLLTLTAPTQSAQEDDEFFKELRKNKKRQKAVSEGKDPDEVEEAEKAPPKPKLPDTADGWIRTIQREWDSDDPEELDLVHQAFEKLGEAIGDNAELREEVRDDFAGWKEEEALDAVGDAISDANVSVAKLRDILEDNRPKALKAIMNPKYTEADNCKLQPEVDEACAPLFGVWSDPVGYSAKHFGLDLTTPAGKLDDVARRLGDLDPALAEWPAPHRSAADYMRAVGAEKLNVSEKEYKAARGILEANEKLEGGTLTEEDKRHVRVLNDYRMMLGKGAVKINLTLCKATFEHSKYMNQIKQLAHNINGHPFGRTPQDRAKRAGFGGSVAENCLVGASNGEEAVWQWYRAAEHHRNMIGNHSIIGVGHDGAYWTQNFSGGGGRRR